MPGPHAKNSAPKVRDDVAWNFAPAQPTLRGVRDGDSWIEMCAGNCANVRISATSAAPVASEFASNAIA
jgi:hypothetical protein